MGTCLFPLFFMKSGRGFGGGAPGRSGPFFLTAFFIAEKTPQDACVIAPGTIPGRETRGRETNAQEQA
jgi:hypothetical protein